MVLAAALSCAVPPAVTAAAPDRIVVDAARVVREVPPRFLGINVNYFLDDDRNPAAPHGGKPDRPLADALKEMGARYLRFPGGDKSDGHLWSVPPFDKPHPRLMPHAGTSWWIAGERDFVNPDRSFKADVLDFDEFMAVCRAADAEPVCVVAFDAMYAPARPGFTPPSKDALLETAVAWVTYANVTKGYGVRWWEIGNESYHDNATAGPAAREYGRDAAEFARAMKAVDPAIRIGLNGGGNASQASPKDRALGRTEGWWRTVLGAAGADADFAVAHEYPGWEWGSYATYARKLPGIGGEAGRTAAVLRELLPHGLADRYVVAMTEINAGDFTKDPAKLWPNTADQGHAIVLADLIGKILWEPTAAMALVWNTRWFHKPGERQSWDAVDDANGLLPAGLAMKAWKDPLTRSRLLWTEGSPHVGAYALADADGARPCLVLINRDLASRPVEVKMRGIVPAGPAAVHVLAGSGPDDLRPALTARPVVQANRGRLAMDLDPVSVTVVSFPAAAR